MGNRFFNDKFIKNQNEFIATLRLARTKNIGPVTFQKFISKYGSPSAALSSAEELLKKKGELPRPLSDIESELEQIEKCGAKIITIFDENYPKLLSEINDAPIVITYIGNIKKLHENNISMVGARYCSANATSFTFKMCKDLSANNQTIVSGLAKGIDTAAHKGALTNKNNDMPTIAVIAGGIDNIYPPENESLFSEIAEKGLLLSENEFGVVPKAEHFPRRNRIISGIAQVTCVVEAALKSGSLITARFALEQGREVACVPGFPADPRSEGTNLLIKRGANLITCADDLIELLQNYDSKKIKTNIFSEQEAEEFFDETSEQTVDLLEVIGKNPVAVDELVSIYGFTASEVNSKLLEYELSGEIMRLPGNKVSKAA